MLFHDVGSATEVLECASFIVVLKIARLHGTFQGIESNVLGKMIKGGTSVTPI
jgi:hypothetical protein